MVPETAGRRHDVRPGGDHHVQAPRARRHLEEGGLVRGKTVRGLKFAQLTERMRLTPLFLLRLVRLSRPPAARISGVVEEVRSIHTEL